MSKTRTLTADELAVFNAAWYAGYLRGLASEPGIPLDIQDKWTTEDCAEFMGDDDDAAD